FSLKSCHSLLLVCGQSFGGIGTRKSLSQQLPLKGKTFRLAPLQAALDCSLNQADSFARLVWRDKLARIIKNLIEEVLAFENLGDQPEFESFFKGNHPPGCGQLHRSSLSD